MFLVESGSMAAPLPVKHYVPGDRLGLRNPDNRSSDIDGCKGLRVFYPGNGQFTNFWKTGQPCPLAGKRPEICRGHHGAYADSDGTLRMDEAIVDARVQASLADPEAAGDILERMMRLREPQGVYASGGCIETTRKYPRSLYPGATQFMLPDA
jgi:hypothetical protein